MKTNYTVARYEHVSKKSFEDVIAAFEAAVGNADDGKFTNGMNAVQNASDWESLAKSLFGPSGFMHVLTFDHGHWLSLYGTPKKAKQYTYGNPLIAHTLIEHDIRVGLHVPLKVLFFENPDGDVVMAYDLPSTLMRQFQNKELDAACAKLDDKLIAFASELTGAPV
jgi:uncharacterized protein (DUF302 family)